MKKGDIFIAKDKNRHPHPIIFLKTLGKGKFSACVISHEESKGNIPMSEEHFFTQDENGENYLTSFNDSYLVPSKFIKEKLWLDSLEPRGKLTNAGIEFVENHINSLNAEHFPLPIWKKQNLY